MNQQRGVCVRVGVTVRRSAPAAASVSLQRVRVRLRVRLERLDSPCVIKIVDASSLRADQNFGLKKQLQDGIIHVIQPEILF